MSICIDGLPFFLNNSDLGQYSRDIIYNIGKFSNSPIYITKDKDINFDIKKPSPLNVDFVDVEIDRFNDNYVNVCNFTNKNNIDIYHCFNNGFSVSDECESTVISTIHSLLPFFYSNTCDDKYNEKFFKSIMSTLSKSDKLITLSYSLKKELINNFSVDDEKIHVVYPSISNFYFETDINMSNIYIKSKFNISSNYIVFCSDLHKRKRLKEMIDLFSIVNSKYPRLKFVILFKKNNQNLSYLRSLKNYIQRVRLSNNVLFISDYNEVDKLHIFNKALAYIDLSIYDGLNLNMLQALKCRCPIICSDIEFHRELLGDYGFFLDLDNIDNFNNNYGYILDGSLGKMRVDDKYECFLDRYSLEENLPYLANIYEECILC